MKLNQVIAIEKGIKTRTYAAVSDLYKVVQKPDLFAGVTRTYAPKDDSDDRLPAENKRVQWRVPEVLAGVERNCAELWNVTARKDWTNAVAKADIAVDGTIVLHDVPVSYLLFLEKQLQDFHSLAAALPVLDEGDTWTYDTAAELYRGATVQTHRTKKVQRPLVLYPATDKHPAQTQLITEDIIAGYWAQSRQSGAMARGHREQLLHRIEKLQQAVKEAREAANVTTEITSPDVGSALFQYMFDGHAPQQGTAPSQAPFEVQYTDDNIPF